MPPVLVSSKSEASRERASRLSFHTSTNSKHLRKHIYCLSSIALLSLAFSGSYPESALTLPKSLSWVIREENDFLGLKNYTQFHSESDHRSPAIIYQCPSGSLIDWGGTKGNRRPGLSHYQTGVISTFLVSLLLRLPFFIDCHTLSDLYEENMIKWKWHDPGHYSGDVNYLDQYNVDSTFIDKVNSSVQNVVQSNRGIIPSFSEESLLKWGLSHQTSFSVAYKYLFKEDKYLPPQRIMKLRIAPMITVQIRVGDNEIHEGCRSIEQICPLQDETKAIVQQFVSCTTKLHRTHNLTRSSIYLLSDCDCLKRQLKDHFESVLNTRILLEEAPTVTADEYDKLSVIQSFIRALNFAVVSDFFIISQRSGVGRQIVARARRFDQTFWGELGDECEALDFHSVAHGWSGL